MHACKQNMALDLKGESRSDHVGFKNQSGAPQKQALWSCVPLYCGGKSGVAPGRADPALLVLLPLAGSRAA